LTTRQDVHNQHLLNDLRSIQGWYLGGAVGGEAKVDRDGSFLCFGRIGLCKSAVANLISAGEIVTRGHQVSLESDTYRLEGNGLTLLFTRMVNPVTGVLMNFYSCNLADTDVVLVTVEDNIRRYSEREVDLRDG
jgi:hypothetical protein